MTEPTFDPAVADGAPPDGVPADLAAGAPGADAPAVAAPASGSPSPDAMTGTAAAAAVIDPASGARSRRRKGILFILLAALVAALLMFTAWYLVFRKPITTLPLPGITQQDLPHYVYSIYGMEAPLGVAVSPSGDRIYVTESGDDRQVHIYDSKGTEVGAFTPPKSTPEDRVPVYVALDPLTGDVYVSDRPTASIYVFDGDGRFRRRFEPAIPLESFAPLGLTFDKVGNLYVSDVAKEPHRILVFDRDGTLTRTIGEPGEFDFPNGLAVDDDGNLFVADSNNGRVTVIDPTDRQVGMIPRGVANGELGLPRGAALDEEGRLYVTDSTGQALRVYTVDEGTRRPKYAGAVGVEGVGDGQFQYPNGVATDSRARVYVVDWANDRVQVWSY